MHFGTTFIGNTINIYGYDARPDKVAATLKGGRYAYYYTDAVVLIKKVC